MDKPTYKLSEKQKKFVKKAKEEGFKVNYEYSGRYMYGEKCPAVYCNQGEFGFKGASSDSLGLGVVVYMP